MSTQRYRVAQWGTGHTGLRALANIIGNPTLELVGVRVYSEAKDGVDAGDLCGLAKTGIRATREIDDIIAARPDCVIYMPITDGQDLEDICKILASGINIVSLVAEFHFRDTIEPEIRQRLEAACTAGQASFYATGPSPGFATEIVPLAAASLMSRLDLLKIYEFGDMRSRSTGPMIESMFGWDPTTRTVDSVAEGLRGHFGDSLRQTAEALGLPIDDVTAKGDVACTTQEVIIAGVTIKAGTVAAWQFEVTGWRDGQPLMIFCNTWYVATNLDKPWNTRDTGWRIVTEGDAPLEIDIFFDKMNFLQVQPSYSANPCLSAVPNVCEAPPGILHTIDMPPITGRFGLLNDAT